MGKKTLNFDRFMSEKKRDYITVTVFGKDYKVANEVPAIVPIMIARAGEDADASAVGLAVLRAGDVMFGKDAIQEMCENGISTIDLGQLIREVFSMVSGQNVDGETDEATYDDSMNFKEKNKPKK